jgi:hypothetical protein
MKNPFSLHTPLLFEMDVKIIDLLTLERGVNQNNQRFIGDDRILKKSNQVSLVGGQL